MPKICLIQSIFTCVKMAHLSSPPLFIVTSTKRMHRWKKKHLTDGYLRLIPIFGKKCLFFFLFYLLTAIKANINKWIDQQIANKLVGL